ncbi:hypothetical protein H4R35_006027 [Dimargaris xerosporica]|nr:hypothetical protein H4R35_006027 [Dimargaris xerosporica]
MFRYAYVFLLVGWLAWCSGTVLANLGKRKRSSSDPSTAQMVGGPTPKMAAEFKKLLTNDFDHYLSTRTQQPPAPATAVTEYSIDSLVHEFFSDEIADMLAVSSGSKSASLRIPSDHRFDAATGQATLVAPPAHTADHQLAWAASSFTHGPMLLPESLAPTDDAPLPKPAQPDALESMTAAVIKAVDVTFAHQNRFNPFSLKEAPEQEMALVTQFLALQQGSTTAMGASAAGLPTSVQRKLMAAIEVVEVYLQRESGQEVPMPFTPDTNRLITYEYQYQSIHYELLIQINKGCLDNWGDQVSTASLGTVADSDISNLVASTLKAHFDEFLAQLPPDAVAALVNRGSLDEYLVKPSAKSFGLITEAIRQNIGLLYMYWNRETQRFELDIFLDPVGAKRGQCSKVLQILRSQFFAFSIVSWPQKWDRQVYNDVRKEVIQYMAQKTALLTLPK